MGGAHGTLHPMHPSDTRQRVAELHTKGLSVREIAQLLGVSTQRVYQQLKALGLEAPTKNGATP